MVPTRIPWRNLPLYGTFSLLPRLCDDLYYCNYYSCYILKNRYSIYKILKAVLARTANTWSNLNNCACNYSSSSGRPFIKNTLHGWRINITTSYLKSYWPPVVLVLWILCPKARLSIIFNKYSLWLIHDPRIRPTTTRLPKLWSRLPTVTPHNNTMPSTYFFYWCYTCLSSPFLRRKSRRHAWAH